MTRSHAEPRHGTRLAHRSTLVLAWSLAALAVTASVACSSRNSGAPGSAQGIVPAACYVHSPPEDGGLVGSASIRCASDAECGAGARCDTAVSPPACILLYCLPETAPCSMTEQCVQGMQCHQGQCNSCSQCGGLCEVDFKSDPKHCGGCDQPVGSGSVCREGQSVCGPATPLACGDLCVDPTTDPQHCGGCAKAVGPGAKCSNGASACLEGRSLCGGGCADLKGDDSHCGSCGHACPAGLHCSDRTCAGDVVSDGKTACAAVCEARGARCVAGRASYSSPGHSSHTDDIPCATIPPPSATWPDGTQGCYNGTCYPGHDSGNLTAVTCTCRS